jgi:hypothetical protein
MLHRAIAVVGSSLVPLAVGTLALPGLELRHAAWVLPALALCMGAVALSTWTDAVHAAFGLLLAWIGVVVIVAVSGPRHGPLAETDLFGPPGQMALAVLAAAAAALALSRRSHLATVEIR